MRCNVATLVLTAFLLAFCGALPSATVEESDPRLPDDWNQNIRLRSVGPANMMGRITSISVYPGDKNIWWAASASGGLLKTTNNGVTFEHQFDDQSTVSIGDVQVSATNPDLLWVGTGEGNPRNSVSWGDGVYKSTDGGKTWKNMGLQKTFQTGRIAIHPEDHNIVYVGSLGRLWGPNPERGLFKTDDGGKNWEKIFYVDDKTGVIDVQLNPQNPEEILIATYERMRDGFDGNDPVKKYGDGSAIYKSIDGGKTFNRLSNGLPTCKLGRIGLNYFAKDPNVIAAIVESEKIAKEPETAAYAGLRGEDADVGAKITTLTEDGPAEKAGLKENDIVVSADGVVLYSYSDLLKEIRKHKSGETLKLVVSRERKPMDIAVELGKRPERPQRSQRRRRRGPPRTPFTGTLGGQAANMQGQQGDDEQEYGGIYLSTDGGDSWDRINTLNPRPMYYSQIRIDPVDRERMYVLGTSLYQSKDGGQTFTGDGGGRAVHVDHHALWIDPDDPRHMILGNDGGLYVTYDRMKNWDHLNHVAIGQFYHVGVGSRIDYRVYGGLQDNGSWGGPVRAANDSGTINTDWFRVGGGDGFITLADPENPDQIYFESQNGGMGRINLATGQSGFIRPRPPRGTRYRFNWKTPFLLSPHNSKIHYSAGNHVFRSYSMGNDAKPISPDITNTDKGAGSALTESPVRAGVLYVGTTDGAVWMTKDGGKQWTALYSQQEEGSQSGDEKDEPLNATGEASDSVEDTGSESESDAKPEKGTVANNLNGTWNGRMLSDRFPEGQEPGITLTLKSDGDGQVSGEVETRRGEQKISSGKYDADKGELTLVIETQRGRREFTATVKGNSMTGEMSMRNGQFQIEFEATRQEDPDDGDQEMASWPFTLTTAAGSMLVGHDDPVSGTWSGKVTIGEMELDVTLILKMDKNSAVTGSVESERGIVELDDGQFSASSKKIYFSGENDEVFLDFEGSISGNTLSGDVSINDAMTAEFEATRQAARQKSESEQDEETAEPAQMREKKEDGKQPGFVGVILEQMTVSSVLEDSPAEKAGIKIGDEVVSIDGNELEDLQQVVAAIREHSAGETMTVLIKRGQEEKEVRVVLGKRPQQMPDTNPDGDDDGGMNRDSDPPKGEGEDSQESDAQPNDPIAGTWTGTIKSPQGDSDVTVKLIRTGKKITGTYETQRSDGDIVEGKFDEQTETLILVAENERFNLEFDGKVSGSQYTGEIDFNGGMFTVEFEMKRSEAAKLKVAEADTKEIKAKTGKPLEKWMPGPRWVSSLEASRHKAERCYISLDGHRSNDDMPYVFVTEDFGETWESVRGDLPDKAGSVRVIREDRVNENVLYLGCEFGAWTSIDRGQSWVKLGKLPTVAVHEIAQHPKLDDIVIGTHGRSIWVGDVAMLRQLDGRTKDENRVLFQPRDVIIWQSKPRRASSGTRKFVASNPPVECRLEYFLANNERELEIEIRDLQGVILKRFDAPPKKKGLHSVSWDLRRRSSGGRFGRRVSAGKYLVEMRIGSSKISKVLTVISDPNGNSTTNAIADEFTWWMYIGGIADNFE